MKKRIHTALGVCFFAMSAGCATPLVMKGNIPFKSEPISRVYFDPVWDNSSGVQLNSAAQVMLPRSVEVADLCSIEPGLGDSFFIGLTKRNGERSATRNGTPFGEGERDARDPLMQKMFNLPANCCPEEDVVDMQDQYGNFTGRQKMLFYKICEKKITPETMILKPNLLKLDEKGYAISIDVYHGSISNKLGSVECSEAAGISRSCIDAPVGEVVDGNLQGFNCTFVTRCVKAAFKQIGKDFVTE